VRCEVADLSSSDNTDTSDDSRLTIAVVIMSWLGQL
jgi:hypothetical protein